MSKLTLPPLAAGFRSSNRLNENFDAIEAALENTLSRDGTTPNQMSAVLDMNSNRIINLDEPVDDNDAVRLVDVEDAIDLAVSVGDIQAYVDDAQTAQEAAETAQELAEETLSAILELTPSSVSTLVGIAETSPGVGGASFPNTVKALRVQLRDPNYTLEATLRGAPFRIARMSKATIDSAGIYPDRAVIRTADRFMPDGTTDATNGGYWVIAEPTLTAEMFGQLHLNNTETTATLRAFHEMAYRTRRPGRLTGDDYTINGPLLAEFAVSSGGLHVTRVGPVTITVAAGTTAMTAVIYARTEAVSNITLDGAPMDIDANDLAAFAVQVGHNGGGSYATVGGHCRVRSITGRNLLAGVGGEAAGVAIIGPYETYDVEDNHAFNVDRAPNGLSVGGECKGISVSQAQRACVMRRCTATNIYAQDDRDADAFAIFGPADGVTGVPLCPLAGFEDCVAIEAEGRTIKAQAAHTRVIYLQAERSGSTTDAVEIDAQWGSLEVDGAMVKITDAVGSSYSVVAPQAQQPSVAPLYSQIERVTVASAVALPRMVAATRAAISPRHTIRLANNYGVRTDNAALGLWSRGIVEINLASVRSSSALLEIDAVDNTFATLRPMCTYIEDDGSDPSAKLALRGSGNRNLLTVNDGGQAFLAQASGTTINKFAAYTPGINPGFHQVFETWYVDWNTIQPGATYDVNLANFTQRGHSPG